ncbi:MAG: hypothetical protein V4722_24615 [Bacteroidota bacterium]
MLKKYAVLLGITIAITLLVIAAACYPGGSQADIKSIGYSWRNNYISNLFGDKAVNGAHNGGRFWAVAGMFFLSAAFALFFLEFSKKIPLKGASKIIKWVGIIGMVFTFLIATPLHDIMVMIASTMFLLGIFYITVFVLKSRLHVFKFLCVGCMLVFYATLFMYGFGTYRVYLPIMQKVTFTVITILIVGLEYFTKREDFQHIKAGRSGSNEAASNL